MFDLKVLERVDFKGEVKKLLNDHEESFSDSISDDEDEKPLLDGE